MSDQGTVVSGPPGEVATSLSRGTNWWGAFVIGLAGTILVTGIVPFAVQSMGAAAIPAIALVVIIGMIVCLCMGELAALLPHRTGGMPSYAYESFQPLGKTAAKHIGGVSGWGYWLGGSRWPRSTCCWPPGTSPCCSTCRWVGPSLPWARSGRRCRSGCS